VQLSPQKYQQHTNLLAGSFNSLIKASHQLKVMPLIDKMTFLNISTQAPVSTNGCQEDSSMDTTKEVYCNMNAHFPWKVHAMLTESEADKLDFIVSWLPDGHSFKVHDHHSFVSLVLPKFFKQTKYKSFQRQLNLWGFTRVSAGDSKGACKFTTAMNELVIVWYYYSRRRIIAFGMFF
jgi:hypothetical protein